MKNWVVIIPRARGTTGGRPQKLDNKQIERVKELYEKKEMTNEPPRSKLTGYHSRKAQLENHFSDASIGEFFKLKKFAN